MRDIHHDAQSVHLGDDLFPELADAVVLGRRVTQVHAGLGGVGDVVVAIVRQRHVAGAEFVVALQRGDVAADHVTVLDADRRDQFAFGVDALDIVGRVGQFDQVGVHLLGHAVNGVELGHGVGPGLRVVLRRSLGLADVDDEETGIQAAGAHLLQIHLPRGVKRVNGFGCEVGRDVIVTVYGQHRFVDGECASVLHGFVILRGLCLGGARIRGDDQQRHRTECGSCWFHDCVPCPTYRALTHYMI